MDTGALKAIRDLDEVILAVDARREISRTRT
jgi:hypothetical protein